MTLFDAGKPSPEALRQYIQNQLSYYDRLRIQRYLLKHPEMFGEIEAIQKNLPNIPEKSEPLKKKAA